MESKDNNICGLETTVYSRIVGYFRPVSMWNKGKAEEFRQRLEFDEKKAVEKELKDLTKKEEPCDECLINPPIKK